MKKISKVATASILLFTLANPLGVLAENNVENISATSNNKLTQDITIQAKEVNGGIVFEVTAAKDTYNTVIHATINGQKFTYNLGNLKKGQVSKVVQPDASVNRKDVNTNKKDAAISKENRTEKSLPNTSVVRELVEKTVSYNTELNGNVIEANVVYKTYELVEKKDEKATEKEVMPEVAKPATPKAETPVESTEAKATEPEAMKPATPKAETPVESTEAEATGPEVAKPATPAPKEEKPATSAPKVEEPVTPAPKVEEPAETAEPKGTEPEAAKPAVPKAEAPAPKVEEPVTPAPKVEEPATPAPKVEEPATPAPKEEKPATPAPKEEKPATPAPREEKPATPAPKVEEPVTPAPKVEEPAETAEPEEAGEGVKPTPKEDASEGKVSEGVTPGATTEEGTPGATGTEVKPAPNEAGTTAGDEGKEAKETEESETNATPKENATEGTGSEGVTPGATTEEGTSEATPGATGTEVKPAPNEAGTTAGDEGKEAKETEESETNATPKENATEGTGSEGVTPGATTEEGTSEATPGVTGTEVKPAPNEAGTTAGDEGKEAKEAGEGVKPTPKEDASEGKVSEGVTPGATTEGTSGATGETSGTISEDEGKEAKEAGEGVKPTPKEDASEGKVSEGATPGATTEGTSETTEGASGATGETSGTTSEDEGKEVKETEEAREGVKPTPKEDAPEGKVSEETTGTEVKPAPKETEENTEEIKQDEELKAFILEEIDNIITGEDGIATSKLKEIDKIQDEEKKAELKDKLKKLTDEAEIEIKKARDNEEAISITERYRDMIDAIEVPGEEYTKPNYSKDNLSNGRNDGTMIEGGSTAIGHGSGEVPSGATQPESSASTGGATESATSTQPATGTNSDSTVADQPQPAATSPASSGQPTNESSASTGVATQPEAGTDNSATTPPQPATETSTTSTTSETSSIQPTAETTSTAATTESTPTAQPQPAATAGTSSFRRAGEYQARARRVARAANQPDGTVNISYNYDGMPDINGFLSDPRENNTVAIPNSATEDKVKELVKAKIQAKAQELAKYGYTVKEKIIFEQDTNVKNFNYVVTFTKEKTGTTGFRIAPEVQVRAKKVVKRDLSNKTKQINIYYNLTALKDIAGALGNVRENNLLTLPGNATKEEIKKAIEEKTKSQIEQLNKQGFKVTSTTDLDRIVEGSDNYDYVVEFTKETKAQSVGNTGFRKAPLVQKRAKRSVEGQETVDVNIYFNLKTLPGIAGALDVDGDTTIKLPKNSTVEQVKAAIQTKIAKVEKRGYKVSDFYFGAKTERGYDFVVEFKK